MYSVTIIYYVYVFAPFRSRWVGLWSSVTSLRIHGSPALLCRDFREELSIIWPPVRKFDRHRHHPSANCPTNFRTTPPPCTTRRTLPPCTTCRTLPPCTTCRTLPPCTTCRTLPPCTTCRKSPPCTGCRTTKSRPVLVVRVEIELTTRA